MSKIADRNDAVASDLKRRLFWAYAWFFICVAIIPLGFICPCGLAMMLNQEQQTGPAAFFAIASLLLPFVGLGGMMLMGGDRSKYVRGVALLEIANDRNLRYTYSPKSKQHDVINSFRLLAAPDNEFAGHLMAGKLKKLPFLALDYSHAYGFGKFSTVYAATVFVFKEGFEDLPNFVLYPRGWIDALRELVKGKPFKLSSKEFNKSFVILGDDPDIPALFSRDLIDLCLEESDLTMEVNRGRLLIYRWETILRVNDYEDFLEMALDMAKLLQQS